MDGSDVTESFANFEIIFTSETYTSSGGGDVWPDGTGVQWIFKGEDPNNASTIIRIDQVEVLIVVTKGDQSTAARCSTVVRKPIDRTN